MWVIGGAGVPSRPRSDLFRQVDGGTLGGSTEITIPGSALNRAKSSGASSFGGIVISVEPP